MKHSELLLSAMDGVKDDYLAEANSYTAEKARPRKRGILIAAGVAAALAITAGAMGFTMHQAVREDLKISDPEEISEYTEYVPTDAENARTGDADSKPAQLISTVCSGKELVAYISVSDIPEELGANYEDYSAIWDVGSIDRGNSVGLQQVSYDALEQTALLRLEVYGLGYHEKEMSATLIHRRPDGDVFYGPVQIPVTESTALHADVNQTVAHPNMEEFQAEIQSVDVYAMYVSAAVRTPSFEQTMDLLGADAKETLDQMTGGPILGLRDADAAAKYAYRIFIDMMMNPYERMTIDPDSPQSPHYIMEGATLNLSDGTKLALAGQERRTAGLWIEQAGNSGVPWYTGEWTFNCELANPLNLTQIESITIGEETYPLTAK